MKEKDRILVSDLLFYLQNKLQSIPNDDIVKICDNFYKDDYVWNEKERFFLASGKKNITRRTADKKIVDLNNILNKIRLCDDIDKFQPTCVAVELSNLPQTEDGSVPNSDSWDVAKHKKQLCDAGNAIFCFNYSEKRHHIGSEGFSSNHAFMSIHHGIARRVKTYANSTCLSSLPQHRKRQFP